MVLANMENTIVNKIGKFLGVEGNFASWFVLIGIITQCLTWYIMGDTLLALCSGIAGVISVVLCSQKKFSFYFWGLLQLITIIIISYNSGLYGKVVENGFYLMTMFVGMSEWKKNKEAFKGHIGDVAEMIRIVMTCRKQTPNLYDILCVLGSEEVNRRLDIVINKIK